MGHGVSDRPEYRMRTAIGILTLIVGLLSAVLWVTAEQKAAQGVQLQALQEASKQAQERSVRDRKALVARQAEIASKTRELARAQRNLTEALGANKTWSDTYVPTEVQEALLGRSGGPGGPTDGLQDSP